MKLLHVIPNLALEIGGPAAALVGLCLALEQRGVHSAIFTTDLAGTAGAPGGLVRDDELPEGADELDLSLFPARRPHRIVFSPDLYRALGQRAGEFDLIHIHSLFLFPQYAAFRHARRRGIPYVVSPRGSLDPWLRSRGRIRKAINDALWQKRMLAGAAALHMTAEDEKELLSDIAPGVPRHVVPNGIDWDSFQSLPSQRLFRERCLDGSEAPIVLFLGRVSYKKGLEVLIPAFREAFGAAPEPLLVIAGPDHEELTPRLEAQARELGVADRVRFTGMLMGDLMLSALASATVWALTSHTENFAIAAAEALAAGCPSIISTKVNISPEIARERAAIVVEPESSTVAHALRNLFENAPRRREVGERARSFARRYDWAFVAPQLEDMYERVLGRGETVL